MALVAIAAFAAGVIVGLILAPSTEREHAAHVDGWLEGHRYARAALDTPREEKM